MQIVCPHCDTSYDVAAASIGPQGRTVRCVRCRQTWLAHAVEAAAAAAEQASFASAPAESPPDAPPADDEAEPRLDAAVADRAPEVIADLPAVDSPPIAHDGEAEGAWIAPQAPQDAGRNRRSRLPKPRISLPVATAAMAGLCLAIAIWRQDVVRMLPQTAGFFELIRLPVNLRQMAFKDVTISTETVNGAKVYLIEGAIVGLGRSAVDIPRLRFIVTDANGQEIYAWNAQPEQASVQPGERVPFRSRLASPPAEAREVTVRFFNRHDLGAGRA